MMTRTRIDLLAPPFAGHLHPILGMARALHPHYEVRVATTPCAESSVRAAGLTPVTLLADWERQLRDVVDTPAAVGSHPLRLYRQFVKALGVHEQVRIELERLYENSRPDLLIADFTLVAAGPVARSRGIPWWTSLPSPCVLEGGDGPPCYFGGLIPRAGLLGTARDAAGRAMIRGFKHVVGALFREKMRRLGLSSVYRADGSEAIYSDERLLIIGWRDLEFRKDWPAYTRFVSPLLFTPPTGAGVPAFTPGRQHVLVTLGTHLAWAKQAVAQSVRELARRTPHLEYHFSDGDVGGNAEEGQANFHRFSFIDYEQHLGRYDLVIHHGGSGVMHHCLTKGRPAIVYPVDYDQFDNAARLEHAGLARRLRRLRDLPLLVESALTDERLKERCRLFAERHGTDGSEQAFRDQVGAWFSESRRSG